MLMAQSSYASSSKDNELSSFTSNVLVQRIVTGQVVDVDGAGLPGVSVIVKGTLEGTSTDANGQYRITVPDGQNTLVFSYIGFVSIEEAIDGRSTINVEFSEESTALNEVVVTALGITRDVKSLTYAAQNIKGDQLNEAKEVNIVNSLQGKVAGVTITRNANGPGGDAKVLIRGNRSITGNNQPLYVIDGVPLSGSVSMLNSDDVESMTILKGPSAAALYGSQGQNGAIVITTKRGKVGELAVNYNGGFTFENAAVLPELQYEYGQGDAGVYSPNSEHSWGPKAAGQPVTLWNGHTVPLEGQPGRLKEFFRTAHTINNSLSINGGSEKMQTYFSYANTYAQGIMRNNDLNRHNVDLKIDNNLTSKLSFFTKLTYIYEDVNNRLQPGEGGTYALPSMFRSPTSIPTSEMRQYAYTDESGIEKQSYWKPGSSILLNPYWALNRITYFQKKDRVLGLISAKYQFNDWLDLQVRGSIDKTIQKNDNKIYADNYFSLVGSTYNYSGSGNQGTNVDALLSFKRDLSSRFNLTGNIGAALQQGNYEGFNGNANGLNKANFFFMNNAKNPSITNYAQKSPQVQSVYGTATLAYNSYLYLDATARNDWSSALPKDNQSYFYPSVGLSAIISDMLTLPSWVSYGKARVTVANSGYGGREYLDRNYYTVGAGGAIITPTIQSLGNYKPELTTAFEAGLDWQFLNNRLGFSATYYNTKTKNQLLLIGAPSASLFDRKYINAGLIKNNGIEIVGNITPIRTERFSWDAMVNYSKNNNKIVRLTDEVKSAILVDDRAAQIRADEGGSFGDMYVKDWKRDSQGRRLVDNTGAPILTAGRDVFLGNYNPDYTLGVSNMFTYSNFSLNFLIDYRNGGYVVSGTQALIDADGHSLRSLEGREGGLVLDAVTVDGAKNTQSISAQKYWSAIGDRYPTGGLYAYSATNLRLRELVLGYRIPTNFLGSTRFIKDAKLSVVGRNLFFFHKSAPIDPDITLGINGGGLEYGALPSTRIVGLNLNIVF
jgi:TonB-linked SusC/RagA family outer membrane protein